MHTAQRRGHVRGSRGGHVIHVEAVKLAPGGAGHRLAAAQVADQAPPPLGLDGHAAVRAERRAPVGVGLRHRPEVVADGAAALDGAQHRRVHVRVQQDAVIAERRAREYRRVHCRPRAGLHVHIVAVFARLWLRLRPRRRRPLPRRPRRLGAAPVVGAGAGAWAAAWRSRRRATRVVAQTAGPIGNLRRQRVAGNDAAPRPPRHAQRRRGTGAAGGLGAHAEVLAEGHQARRAHHAQATEPARGPTADANCSASASAHRRWRGGHRRRRGGHGGGAGDSRGRRRGGEGKRRAGRSVGKHGARVAASDVLRAPVAHHPADHVHLEQAAGIER